MHALPSAFFSALLKVGATEVMLGLLRVLVVEVFILLRCVLAVLAEVVVKHSGQVPQRIRHEHLVVHPAECPAHHFSHVG